MKQLFRALLVFCSFLVGFAQEQPVTSPGQQAPSQPQEPTPVDAAPEPTDPAELAIRTIRNRLHNTTVPLQNGNCTEAATSRAKRGGCRSVPKLEELPPGVPSKVTFVDLPPMRLPADQPSAAEIPVRLSDTILVGTVNRIQTYLSEDKTNLYTEYTVAVEQVLMDSKKLSLKSGNVISLDRMGGALRLASGRVLRDVVHGQGAPLIATHKYALFLSYDSRGAWFRTVKSWELRDGLAVPVDDHDVAMAQAGRSHFAGMAEIDFLNAVRDAVGRSAVQR